MNLLEDESRLADEDVLRRVRCESERLTKELIAPMPNSTVWRANLFNIVARLAVLTGIRDGEMDDPTIEDCRTCFTDGCVEVGDGDYECPTCHGKGRVPRWANRTLEEVIRAARDAERHPAPF